MAQAPPAPGGTWLPIAEAYQAAGVSRRSAYRWAKTGRVRTQTEGGKLLVTVESLKAEASRPRCATVARGPVARGTPRHTSAAPAFEGSDEFWKQLVYAHDDQIGQHDEEIRALLRRLTHVEKTVSGSSPEGERRVIPKKPAVRGPLRAPVLAKKPPGATR